MQRLAGKTAIITGAGRGIGREYALALAREGANVVVNDLGGTVHGRGESKQPADEVVLELQQLGVKAMASYEDVSSFEGAARTVQAAIDAFGSIDILITNAGNERRGPLWELTEDDWHTVIGTHAQGTFNFIRNVAPVMRKQQGGSIINITSGAAWGRVPRQGIYAAAKGAIISMMLTLSVEMKPHNTNVNCLSPGLTASRIAEDYFADLKESTGATDEDLLARMVPQPAANMAPLAVFLSSDEGRDITGKIFQVAGDQINLVAPPAIARTFVKPGGWTVDDVFESFPRDF